MLPDINVLVAAHRADHPQHEPAAFWLNQTLKGADKGEALLVPMSVISGFLRLVTNVRIFPMPTSSVRAVDFIDWLLDAAPAKLLEEVSEWTVLRSLMLNNKLAANQVPDAHLAAIAISLSEPFVTFDKGFRRLLPRSLLVLLPAVKSPP